MMSKYCPLTDDDVVYLECLECENQMCRREYESERFYLFIGGSGFEPYSADRALAGKRSAGKQIIIVSSLPGTYAYAKKAGVLFRQSTDPIEDCLMLLKKPDSGALVIIRDKADAFLAKRIKATGIRTHVIKEKNGN